jgi:beta-N-acetylhexosaminidase
MYHAMAAELVAVGYNTILAPCADVNSNPANSIIGVRSFGEDPVMVASLVAAAVQGARDAGAITTVKHFPGHGDTSTDTHRGFARVDRNRAELDALDLLPFRAGVEAGVDIVMTSHILYPALDPENPATLSAPILQDLLRDTLHFDGVILSDSMNMGAIRKHYQPDEAAVLAVLAGVDIIMLAEEHYDHDAATYLGKQLAGIRGVIEAVRQGRISEQRVNDAVRRVLTLKAKGGLFEVAEPDPAVVQSVGNAAHRAIELTAAIAGTCLVRDTGELLPLQPGCAVTAVNAVPRASYEILGRTRGIGPNQTTPAFDIFAEHLVAAHPETTIVGYDDIVAPADLPTAVTEAGVVLVVIENYPLPGVDFDTSSQYQVVDRLARAVRDRLVVVALRDPYALTHLSQVGTVLCTNSSRPCAAQAAVDVVVGRSPASGQLPVSVPGLNMAG